ncbi:conserved hypothetical protein [Talaromyces stipitatus ATCC 10500]|uniref:Methyltransferase type 11 domain-containing protein n=1 Tax=Talaromyces stipitatus (strain ATCC 10500 / CBS 375.48 / QM 6759 / NRRL 1006) TaxID=441959 RepID=B8MM99_TALSN|nr:uncharacterized protein TSTA_099080 [Talaromyces stipitatus ATCC 10500]EED13653.1 conserved hypothetical protein [Talaromyces stipitatus ATCC 10500]
MADSHHRQVATLSSPLRLARKPLLNTIMEANENSPGEQQSVRHEMTRESLHSIQIAMSFSPETARRISTPVDTLSSSSSSCSDEEWQQGLRPFDDLYDASDDDERNCPSLTDSRPSSLATMSIRSSTYSTNSRNRYPSLMIPTASLWPSLVNPHKSSPVPPTPPPKIPVSPAALSMLPGNVPAIHAPPSLDGSLSSDQISNISSPATPDLRPVRDHDWDNEIIRVRQDPTAPSSAGASSTDLTTDEERAIETSVDDWNPLLDSFPAIPAGFESHEPAVLSPDDQHNNPVSPRSESPELDGITLPPAAIATLQHIPLDSTPGPWSETSEKNDEMWQLATPPTNRQQRNSPPPDATPDSELSGYSFTNLSIPSPGGFFSSLDPKSRYTWSLPSVVNPPTTAVAARFYDLPWGLDQGEVVEQVVEVAVDQNIAEDQPTAVPITAIRIPSAQHKRSDSHDSSSPVVADVEELDRSGVPAYEYDEAYDDELKRQAVANLDRTSVWLAAQHSYLSALSETNPVNVVEANKKPEPLEVENRPVSSSGHSPPRKSVRFSEDVQELTMSPLPPPPEDMSKDSIYWRGFQFVLQQSRRRDVFLHSDIRFDAVQSVRLGFPQKHRAALLGKFELEAPERPGYKGPFSQAPRKSVLAEVLAEQALYSNLEKEQMVLSQLYQSMWAVDASRFLNGGRLISRPAAKRLSTILKQMDNPQLGTIAPKRRLRVLDLGGQATCGWAWQLAHDYPDVKVYTVVGKNQEVNSHIKGPANHRRVSVPCLWKLPFRNNQFDVISARSLHALLKTERPAGEELDEYDLCLKECYRCLKPGGYLEFFTMDSSIARAGPLGTAASVEFTFNLKTRGYDPSPTRGFLSRLQRSNFADIKRAWLFLPMGIEPIKPEPMRETPNPRVKSQIDCEAIQGPVGSTADVASMTGLLGGWMWEQWLLKIQMEMGREENDLLKDIGGVFDEGRKLNAGWTCLSGWAMKPTRRSTMMMMMMNRVFLPNLKIIILCAGFTEYMYLFLKLYAGHVTPEQTRATLSAARFRPLQPSETKQLQRLLSITIIASGIVL